MSQLTGLSSSLEGTMITYAEVENAIVVSPSRGRKGGKERARGGGIFRSEQLSASLPQEP